MLYSIIMLYYNILCYNAGMLTSTFSKEMGMPTATLLTGMGMPTSILLRQIGMPTSTCSKGLGCDSMFYYIMLYAILVDYIVGVLTSTFSEEMGIS